jgi:hypothetical protein
MPENVKLLHSAFPLAGTVLRRTENNLILDETTKKFANIGWNK